MNRNFYRYLAFIICLVWGSTFGLAQQKGILIFQGASDASAGVALDANSFVVADDETNQLRVFNRHDPGKPFTQVDVTRFAVIDFEHPELDLEGAARLGDRIYWIGSHGRNKDGKWRSNRSCFFATDIRTTGQQQTLVPVGRVYRRLLDDLLREPMIRALDVERSVRLKLGLENSSKQRKQLAPKRQGLNIEALSVGPDGKGLLIGFRNPRPTGPVDKTPKALVVPLSNPEAVLTGKAPPEFGAPLLWNLRGFGLRSMDYVPALQRYLLVAGAHTEGRNFVLYNWSGRLQDQPVAQRSFSPPQSDLNIEALMAFPNETRVLLLSDDGARLIPTATGQVKNKDQTDLNKRTFRGMWVDP